MDDRPLVYESYEPEKEGLRESLCTLGNGYFATRGATADSSADGVHYPGTYIAGGYNRLVTTIEDRKIENEDLVNFPNWLPLTFRIDDGDWFRLDDVEILTFRQELAIKEGLLTREIHFRDPAGKTTTWYERRLVSMADCHLGALSVDIRAEDWSGKLTVRSGLDGSVINAGVARYRKLASQHLEVLKLEQPQPDVSFLHCRTNQSHIDVAMAACTNLYRSHRPVETERQVNIGDEQISQTLACDIERGDTITVEKILALYTSRDQAISEPGLEAKQLLRRAGRFDDLLSAHKRAWEHLWDDCNIVLDHEDIGETSEKLRVYIFHLLQTVSPHSVELDIGIPARGWHGEAYRGHIFWDELFIFPFLNLRLPNLTRALLRYRYRRLPEAREAAREAGYKGAMYPWQSASNGREETQQMHLNPESGRWIPDNSHRQRHINSAIAYNIWQYYQVTDDHEFLYFYGAEMLIEIARFWASIAVYNEKLGRYEIKGVMGPDEYQTAYPDTDPEKEAGLDNNAYTNVMAAWVLSRAKDVIDCLPKSHCEKLCESIGLGIEEISEWETISRKLRVPFHGDGIISQFEGYDQLAEFDWKAYEKKYGDIQRLDRILEAEGDTPNRYKASKQADVLMLFYLFSADELALLFEQLGYPFDRDSIPKNVEYYLARTSHGSTLSRVVHSWVLARTDRSQSWHLFQRALESDIADIQNGTTPEGIHTGAMAGTIDLMQRCYVGIEIRANILHFDPALPEDLEVVRAKLRYRRQVLDVEATHETLTVSSRVFTASPITVGYRGRFRDVAPGETYEFRLLKPEDRDRDENRMVAEPSRSKDKESNS